LKYRQPRLPLRNSGSTPAYTGKVSTAPASGTNSCATSRSSKPSVRAGDA
jgi:hypothetical protein